MHVCVHGNVAYALSHSHFGRDAEEGKGVVRAEGGRT